MGLIRYEDFRALVEVLWDDIPSNFTRDLQGVHVFPEAKPDPGLGMRGVWRMGEYLDPGPPSVFGGFGGLGRHIALYYGSFVALARHQPRFDWEYEIWVTLLHELRHHVESLAGRDDLAKEDFSQLQALKKRR